MSSPSLADIPLHVLAERVLELVVLTGPPLHEYESLRELRQYAGEMARRVEIQ